MESDPLKQNDVQFVDELVDVAKARLLQGNLLFLLT